MKHISCFTGIGSFDIGFERAGIETVLQVEIDLFCNRVLEVRFPNVKRIRDIKEVVAKDIEEGDILSAGFPCQDLSIAGKGRKGLAGERSGLFWQIVRLVESKPIRWIVFENVPGLFSANEGRDFAVILNALDKCGYGLAWRVFDSRYFGVAQRRRRVFIVGYFGDPRPAAKVLFESESVSRNFAKKQTTRSQVARTITTSTQRWKPNQETYVIRTSQTKGNWRNPIRDKPQVGGTSYCIGTLGADGSGRSRDGREASQVIATLRGSGTGVTGRMPTENPQGYLITSQAIDSNRMRATTGIPRQLDECPDSPRYRALGNAVTVNVAEWIGKRIAEVQVELL